MKIKLTITSIAALTISHYCLAAQPVGAGIPIMQIPPTPTPKFDPPTFEVQEHQTPPPPNTIDTRKIRVNTLNIQGEKVFTEMALVHVMDFIPESELSITDLRLMTSKIVAYYHQHGYFLCQVYLPTQTINDGIITIQVVEGEYGSVTIDNQSHLSNPLAKNLISGLDKGNIIEASPLETRLLLLSDLPGVRVNSTLLPGATSGSSDLLVKITPGATVTGSVEADNAGLEATGAYRVGGTVNINNMAGLGDVASLSVLSSFSGMTYGRASYQIQVDRATVGAAYTQIDYSLGKNFSSLGIHGSAKIASLYGSYPLIRSRTDNLYVQLGYDWRTYEEDIDSTGSITSTTDSVIMPGIYGNHRDAFWGGSLTTYGLVWSIGNLNIQTNTAQLDDAKTAQTNGQYNKLSFNAMRLQNVDTTPFSLYGSINGQIASKNLNIWEKMVLGGFYGVRAYSAGTAFGDQGYIVNLEARYLLPVFSESIPGGVSLIAFYDFGSVQYNVNTWTGGNNNTNLSGAGVGINWSDVNNFTVKGYYAHPVGSSSSEINATGSGQFWIQAIKYF